MAPPIPELSPSTLKIILGPAQMSALESCPLKTLAQYDCAMKQDLPRSSSAVQSSTSNSTAGSTTRSTPSRNLPSKLVCTEFLRYFRRCADVGLGPNVEVTSLMGITRPPSQTDDVRQELEAASSSISDSAGSAT